MARFSSRAWSCVPPTSGWAHRMAARYTASAAQTAPHVSMSLTASRGVPGAFCTVFSPPPPRFSPQLHRPYGTQHSGGGGAVAVLAGKIGPR
jgi:hypothetical protein